MSDKSKRVLEAERMGLLRDSDELYGTIGGLEPNEAIGSSETALPSYGMVLSGYGDYTPITVRSSSIPLDANLE